MGSQRGFSCDGQAQLCTLRMTDSDNCQTPAVEVAYIFLFLAGVTLFSHLSQFKVARALAENPIYTDSALSVSN